MGNGSGILVDFVRLNWPLPPSLVPCSRPDRRGSPCSTPMAPGVGNSTQFSFGELLPLLSPSMQLHGTPGVSRGSTFVERGPSPGIYQVRGIRMALLAGMAERCCEHRATSAATWGKCAQG